jgi:hypothetical protein
VLCDSGACEVRIAHPKVGRNLEYPEVNRPSVERASSLLNPGQGMKGKVLHFLPAGSLFKGTATDHPCPGPWTNPEENHGPPPVAGSLDCHSHLPRAEGACRGGGKELPQLPWFGN